MIGLRSFKEVIREVRRLLEIEKERLKNGISSIHPRLHLVFQGNPVKIPISTRRISGTPAAR